LNRRHRASPEEKADSSKSHASRLNLIGEGEEREPNAIESGCKYRQEHHLRKITE
jgi:hypothetical protein